MDIPKELFTININQLIGKLHLAGQQQVPNTVVINTAIENPTANPDPQNPGSTTFSTKGSGQQIAFARVVEYQPLIDLNKDSEYVESQKMKEEISKSQESGAGKDSASKDQEKLKDKYLKIFKKYNLQGYSEDKSDFDKTSQSFKDALEKENKKREEKNTKVDEDVKKEIVKDIETYFSFSFIGKDENGKQDSGALSKVKSAAEESSLIQLDDDGSITDPTKFNYSKYVNNGSFDIDAISEDVEKQIQKNSEKGDSKRKKTVAVIVPFEVSTK